MGSSRKPWAAGCQSGNSSVASGTGIFQEVFSPETLRGAVFFRVTFSCAGFACASFLGSNPTARDAWGAEVFGDASGGVFAGMFAPGFCSTGFCAPDFCAPNFCDTGASDAWLVTAGAPGSADADRGAPQSRTGSARGAGASKASASKAPSSAGAAGASKVRGSKPPRAVISPSADSKPEKPSVPDTAPPRFCAGEDPKKGSVASRAAKPVSSSRIPSRSPPRAFSSWPNTLRSICLSPPLFLTRRSPCASGWRRSPIVSSRTSAGSGLNGNRRAPCEKHSARRLPRVVERAAHPIRDGPRARV